MSNDELKVKSLSITIQRGKHNKENPYVMISKKMLRDKALSPKAKGILCFLLSLPDTWKVHPRHLAESLGVGKDLVYAVLNELLIAGYAFKTVIKDDKSLFSGVNYEFYEEALPVEERYKEKITVSGNPDTENLNLESPTLVKKDRIENRDLENITPPLTPPISAVAESAKADSVVVSSSSKAKKIKPSVQFSQEVEEMAVKMINIVMKQCPVYRPPENLQKLYEQVDILLNKDKQDPDTLLRTFEWACADNEKRDEFNGWQSVICTNSRKGKTTNPAELFRRHLDKIYSNMSSQPKRKFAPSSKEDEHSRAKTQAWLDSAL